MKCPNAVATDIWSQFGKSTEHKKTVTTELHLLTSNFFRLSTFSVQMYRCISKRTFQQGIYEGKLILKKNYTSKEYFPKQII